MNTKRLIDIAYVCLSLYVSVHERVTLQCFVTLLGHTWELDTYFLVNYHQSTFQIKNPFHFFLFLIQTISGLKYD